MMRGGVVTRLATLSASPGVRHLKKRNFTIVKFNVGGKEYACSDKIIADNRNSEAGLLRKLVSNARKSDPEEAIFIDRDGDMFAHVLNYLRNGSLDLPVTISKSMVERELDYYGVAIEKDSITATAETVPAYLEVLASEYLLVKKKHDAAKIKRDAFLVAMESHRQFHLDEDHYIGHDWEVSIHIDEEQQYIPDYITTPFCPSEDYEDLLEHYLGEFFGLEFIKLDVGKREVTVKKK